MLKSIGVKVAKAIDAVERRTMQAGLRLRTNACCPMTARSNEKYLARVLTARQVDLDVCLEDLKANERVLARFSLAMLVCFTFGFFILRVKSRRDRQQFEVQIRQRDVLIKELQDKVTELQNGGTALHSKSECHTLHLTSPGNSYIGHELEMYAEQIDDCLQQ